MVYLLRKSFKEPRRKPGNLPEKAGLLRKNICNICINTLELAK